MAIRNKKKNPVLEAREKVNAAVEAFSTLAGDLFTASDTLTSEAAGNRNQAGNLLTEAEALEIEAAQAAKVATKLEDFLA